LAFFIHGCRKNSQPFPRLQKPLLNLPRAPAKKPATATKNVRGKSRTSDRITKSQSAQYGTDRVVLIVEAAQRNVVAMINKNIFQLLMGVAYPTFNADAEVTHEEIFDIHTAPPNMI